MAVHVAVEGFLPAVGHLDRPLGAQRQHARVDLHADILARAKGATDAGEMEADLFGWQIEARSELVEVGVEPLRRDEEIHPAVRGGNRKARFGTEGRLVLHAGLVHALHPDVGGRLGVAMDDRQGPHHVALGMDGRRRRLECALHVRDGRQDLVVDGDLLQRGPRQLGVVGGDDGHGLARIPHHFYRQYRLVLDV